MCRIHIDEDQINPTWTCIFSTQSVELEIYPMLSQLANGNYDLRTCAACVK